MFNSNCASVPLVASIDGGYGGNNGFLNGDGLWGLIIILALLGWGGNGFGGFGGGNGGVANEVQRGFDNQSVLNKLNGLENGLCDGFYSQNTTMLQGFNGLQQTVANGFHGVDNAICNLGYNVQSGFNGLSAQLAQCCCDNRAAISEVRYDMATQACDTRNLIQNTTRDIIDGQNANTRAILDFMVQSKMDEKDSKISQLETELMLSRQNAFITANQDAQTATLIRRLGADCPVNAVVVQPPTPVTFPTNCCGQFSGYGYNNSCGCGCA